MKLIRLIALVAGAAYLYKRFAAEAEGKAETERAEPYSSEALDTAPETLTQPTWLKPADA